MSQQTATFADASTGLFTDRVITGSPAVIAANTPPGCVAVPGRHDHLCRRLDRASGQVVPYQPPAPADDEMRTWSWDATQERWVPTPTDAARAHDLLAERNRRLSACDWTQVADVVDDMAPQLRAAWRQYRKALRDITDQPTFPASVTWPGTPST